MNNSLLLSTVKLEILDKEGYTYMGGKGLPAPKPGETIGGASTK